MITKHSLSRNVGLEEVELFFLYTVNKYASPIFKLLPALETLEIWLFFNLHSLSCISQFVNN